MWPPAASPPGRSLPSFRPLAPRSAVRVLAVALPGAARPRRLFLAAPCATSETAAAAEEGEEERRWWRGAEEMDAELRRDMAIRRLQEEAEEAGTGRSRREFAVFETARGDTLFTQSWTPAAADRVRGGLRAVLYQCGYLCLNLFIAPGRTSWLRVTLLVVCISLLIDNYY